MKARQFLPAGIVLLVVVVLALVAAPRSGSRSVHDRTARGYRAAYAWLEGAAEVGTWDAAFDAGLPADATLVLAFPVERPLGIDDTAALLHFVSRGGRLVLLLDGTSPADPPVDLVEKALGVTVVRESPRPPYAWGEWRDWAAARRAATGPHGTLALGDPEWYLICDEGEILAQDADEHVRACSRALGDGELVVVSDATVFQNDHLGRADNLAFLDTLLGGRRVLFGEWSHGDAPLVRSVPGHVPALLFAHLGALWLVGALTLARRFGDPLPPPALPAASMARALHALATLHRGKGHANDAAARLAALLRARAARKGVPAEALPTADVRSDEALLTYAARVAATQEEHRL